MSSLKKLLPPSITVSPGSSRPPRLHDGRSVGPPAGTMTTRARLGGLLEPGDTVIDGGNSFLQGRHPARPGARREADHLRRRGTSGGVFGLERGYCLMVGGDKAVVQRLDPIFKTLAPGRGDVERTAGRDKLASPARPRMAICTAARSVPATSSRWSTTASSTASCRRSPRASTSCAGRQPDRRRGAPLRPPGRRDRRGLAARQRASSWLIDLTARALVDDPALAKFSGHVQDSGEAGGP